MGTVSGGHNTTRRTKTVISTRTPCFEGKLKKSDGRAFKWVLLSLEYLQNLLWIKSLIFT